MSKRPILWKTPTESIELSEPKSQTISDEIATRERCDYVSIMGALPDPDIVLRKMGKDIRVYEEQLTDPHVASCFGRRKAGTKKRLWEIDRGDAKSKHAKFIEEIFKREEFELNDAIDEILDYSYYGFEPLEITWAAVNNAIIPIRITAKPPEWFCFGNNNELLLRTKQNYNGEPVPEKKFLVAQNSPRYTNPYGKRIASQVFWYALFKKNGLKWWVSFLEKFGIPYIIGKTPRGSANSENNELRDKLAAMVRDAVAVIPDDSSVELMAVSEKSGTTPAHQALIDFCDKSISKAFLGHSAAADSTPGKLGGEDVSNSATADIIESDSVKVCQVFNKLINWTIDINFGEGAARPKFSLYDKEEVDDKLASRDKTLIDAGQVKFTKKYYMENYNLEEDDFEVVATVQPPKPTDGTKPVIAPGMPDGQAVTLSEGDTPAPSFADQAAVDELLGSLSASTLQEQLNGCLKPVIELIESSASFDDVLNKIASVYPKMDDTQIDKTLSRAMFLADAKGRLSAQPVQKKGAV